MTYKAVVGAACVAGWVGTVGAAGAWGATIRQTHSFDGTSALGTDLSQPNTSQDFTTVPAGGFSATIQPFNTALGTLQSVTISWSYVMSVDAYTASGTNGYGGYAVLQGAGGGDGYGEFTANGIAYGGTSLNGAANGMGPPQADGSTDDIRTGRFTVTNTPSASSNTIDVINPGNDPRVIATVSGASPYTLTWNVPERFTLQNIDHGTVTRTAAVTVDYTYVPEPAGLTASAAALALLIRRRRK
ncbi:MAG: hypothetical protein ACTHM6_03270 [Tepidisphaeraceae bacterium]